MTSKSQVRVSSPTSHSVNHEINKNVDVASRQTSSKFDGWRHDLYPTGAALRQSDIDYYKSVVAYSWTLTEGGAYWVPVLHFTTFITFIFRNLNRVYVWIYESFELSYIIIIGSTFQ
jgi:hypothetical protein